MHTTEVRETTDLIALGEWIEQRDREYAADPHDEAKLGRTQLLRTAAGEIRSLRDRAAETSEDMANLQGFLDARERGRKEYKQRAHAAEAEVVRLRTAMRSMVALSPQDIEDLITAATLSSDPTLRDVLIEIASRAPGNSRGGSP